MSRASGTVTGFDSCFGSGVTSGISTTGAAAAGFGGSATGFGVSATGLGGATGFGGSTATFGVSTIGFGGSNADRGSGPEPADSAPSSESPGRGAPRCSATGTFRARQARPRIRCRRRRLFEADPLRIGRRRESLAHFELQRTGDPVIAAIRARLLFAAGRPGARGIEQRRRCADTRRLIGRPSTSDSATGPTAVVGAVVNRARRPTRAARRAAPATDVRG